MDNNYFPDRDQFIGRCICLVLYRIFLGRVSSHRCTARGRPHDGRRHGRGTSTQRRLRVSSSDGGRLSLRAACSTTPLSATQRNVACAAPWMHVVTDPGPPRLFIIHLAAVWQSPPRSERVGILLDFGLRRRLASARHALEHGRKWRMLSRSGPRTGIVTAQALLYAVDFCGQASVAAACGTARIVTTGGC